MKQLLSDEVVYDVKLMLEPGFPELAWHAEDRYGTRHDVAR